jgi:hypothetical protein
MTCICSNIGVLSKIVFSTKFVGVFMSCLRISFDCLSYIISCVLPCIFLLVTVLF